MLEGERWFRLSVVVIGGFVRVTQRSVTYSGEPRALPSFFSFLFIYCFEPFIGSWEFRTRRRSNRKTHTDYSLRSLERFCCLFCFTLL